MGIIKARQLVHEYIRRDEEGNVESISTALDHVDLDVEAGDFIAILGHNGSGKSTLAKHINALLLPSEGSLWVDGRDVTKEENTFAVRQTAGMVFQNPDNQIIASVVEEDVGFGPENIGVPTDEIWKRVEESLGAVGMLSYRHHSPNKLSGGQKQRVAIAGVMAMEPKCIVLDEPTAMLDPNGRKEEPEKRRDDHFDHTLYGGSRGCRQGDRDGSGKSRHAGNTAGSVLPGGKTQGVQTGCAAGDDFSRSAAPVRH